MSEVLFVCHANICRSPMAERLARLDGLGGLSVSSAGTHVRGGDPIHPGAAAALREVGADPDGFASRPVTAAMVGAAVLVLTATRAERAICATLCPPALPRVFTLRQFGRLAAAVRPTPFPQLSIVDRLVALREEVAQVRGTVQPVPPADDDLADPVNGTAADMRDCVAVIRAALAPWLSRVADRTVAGVTAAHRSAAAGSPYGPGAP